MTIAITGSTGQLGRLVIDELKKRGHEDDVVALARSVDKAEGLGLAVRKADYDEPETLAAALTAVDTLLLISASEIGQRKRQHQNVIDAAHKAGVQRIVYTSLLHANTSSLSLADEHRATEAALAASGIPHTILRNGWYNENYTGSIGAALTHGALIGSAGDGKISAAARADYAEAAAVVVTSDGHVGKIYELAGDEAFTLQDLAAEISRQTGRDIPHNNLPVEEYAAILIQTGLPDGLAHEIAGWDASAAQGALFDDSRQLSGLIGRPTTPISVSVADALAVSVG